MSDVETIGDEGMWVHIPEDVAETHRKRRERRQETQAQWETANRAGRVGQTRRPPYATRLFIVWDGEGPRDTGYSLLGNSEGDEICYPTLRTTDCLDLFLRSAEDHPYAIHVSFGFTYDVSCILWELSWGARNRLYKFGKTYWHGYVIRWIPRKWIEIKKDGVHIKIFDIQSFFGGSLVSALAEWKIGGLPWGEPAAPTIAFGQTASDYSVILHTNTDTLTTVPTLAQVLNMDETTLVRVFKKLRSEFEYKDIEQIKCYMRLELKYTKILIEEVRDAFRSAGYLPKSWHGPGAIARMAFRRHSIYDVLTESPLDVRIASQYAFIAGRFELVKAGHIGRVWTADINSAYPWFCSQLPNLRRGKWRRTDKFEPGTFSVWHVDYTHRHRASSPCGRGETRRTRSYELYPLPKRERSGNIIWGPSVRGWYWEPEVSLIADDKDATIIEGWVFDEDDSTDRPFAWIADYYAQRKQWKAEGNPAQYALKLCINAIYGQLAQRVGWDEKNKRPPKTHQLEYAGWITSACRAMVYRVARRCGDHLVSIDTDGITSSHPFDWLSNSKDLGGWELDEYEDSVFWQSGIYILKLDGEWKKARSRGIGKGKFEPEDLIEAMDFEDSLRLTKRNFVTFGQALNGQFDKVNTWEDVPSEFEMGGHGKRVHHKPGCCTRVVRNRDGGNGDRTKQTHRRAGSHQVHYLRLPFGAGNVLDRESQKHPLPWVDGPEKMREKDLITRKILFSRNDLDPEDEWVLDYAER